MNRPDREVADIDKEPWIDFMIDLANFERRIFYTFDCEGNEGKAFATADTPDSKLKTQPSLSVATYGFPVAHYYHTIRDGKTQKLPPAKKIFVAVYRKNYQTITMPLGKPHYLFLNQMCNGTSVDSALWHLSKIYNVELAAIKDSWDMAGKTRNTWIVAGFFVTN